MKINVEIDGKSFVITLSDSPDAREFASMLPLTLPFKDFSNNEKIAYLPTRLSRTKGAEDSTARVGDFAYYAPWGNIIIYHGAYSASPDVIKLGELDGDVGFFRTPGEVTATITKVD